MEQLKIWLSKISLRLLNFFLYINVINYSFLAHLAKGHVSFCHHLASVVLRKLSHLNLLLWNPRTKLNQTCQGWVSFKIVSDRPALHSRWLLLLKIEISSIVHCCFVINLNELKFNCSYIEMSSLTYIPGFSVKFFFQPIYTDYANWHILIKDHI